MLTRRGLLSRLGAALGVAALAPVAKMAADDDGLARCIAENAHRDGMAFFENGRWVWHVPGEACHPLCTLRWGRRSGFKTRALPDPANDPCALYRVSYDGPPPHFDAMVEELRSARTPIVLGAPSTLERWNPNTGRWEPWGDSMGRGTFVPITDALAAWEAGRA